MKAVVFKTDGIAYVRDFKEPMMQSAEGVIGDWVERVRPVGCPGYLMLVDESGLLKNLTINIVGSLFYGTQFHGSPIVGDIIIAKDTKEKVPIGLSDPEIEAIIEQASEIAAVYGHTVKRGEVT